jgi:hypothetical protein
VREVVIFADNDERGLKAADDAIAAYNARDLNVKVLQPKQFKDDFNDVLCADPAAQAELQRRRELRRAQEAREHRRTTTEEYKPVQPIFAPGYLGKKNDEGSHE